MAATALAMKAAAPSRYDGLDKMFLGRYNGQWSIEEFTTAHWISVQHAPLQYPF